RLLCRSPRFQGLCRVTLEAREPVSRRVRETLQAHVRAVLVEQGLLVKSDAEHRLFRTARQRLQLARDCLAHGVEVLTEARVEVYEVSDDVKLCSPSPVRDDVLAHLGGGCSRSPVSDRGAIVLLLGPDRQSVELPLSVDPGERYVPGTGACTEGHTSATSESADERLDDAFCQVAVRVAEAGVVRDGLHNLFHALAEAGNQSQLERPGLVLELCGCRVQVVGSNEGTATSSCSPTSHPRSLDADASPADQVTRRGDRVHKARQLRNLLLLRGSVDSEVPL